MCRISHVIQPLRIINVATSHFLAANSLAPSLIVSTCRLPFARTCSSSYTLPHLNSHTSPKLPPHHSLASPSPITPHLHLLPSHLTFTCCPLDDSLNSSIMHDFQYTLPTQTPSLTHSRPTNSLTHFTCRISPLPINHARTRWLAGSLRRPVKSLRPTHPAFTHDLLSLLTLSPTQIT